MSKISSLTEWLMQCPQLSALWNISAELSDGANILIPSGTSEMRYVNDSLDVINYYEANIVPLPSVYEEFQVNCYKSFVNNDNSYNVMNYDDVEKVIEWVREQDEKENFPVLEGEKVVSIDVLPFQPQIRGVDPDTYLVCYYFTIRIRYVNTSKGRSVGWQM